MTSPEVVHAGKAEFARRFLDAIRSGSIEQCAGEILPFAEYQLLTADTKTKEKKYANALQKQCKAFFKHDPANLLDSAFIGTEDDETAVNLDALYVALIAGRGVKRRG